MKVAQINVSDYGSTGRIMKQIAARLKEEGQEALCYYGRGKPGDGQNMVRFASTPSVYAHGIKARLLDKMGHGSKADTKKLIKMLEAAKPDIVHLHNIHGYYLNIEILFNWLKENKIKTLWTLHDCWAFTGGCAYFLAAGCEKWRTGCGGCSQINSYPKRLVDKSDREYAFKKAAFTGHSRLAITTPSDWLKGLAKASFLGEYPVTTVANGIDMEVFYPRGEETDGKTRKKLGVPEGNKLMLAVANVWDHRKRLGDFEALAEKLKDAGVTAVAVGLTEDQKAKLKPGIIGITRTENQQQLAEIYSAADLFVSTSAEESFSLVIGEAMASGTPVVTVDGGGCAELITPEIGRVVKRDDMAGLEEAAKEMLAAGGGLKAATVARCRENYSLDKMLDGFIKIYGGIYGK